MGRIVTDYMEIYHKALEDMIWVAENTTYIGIQYFDDMTINKLKKISSKMDSDIMRRRRGE